MSEYIFKLPDLGEGTVESEIGEWFIKVGDPIKEEDVVGTVMTDKAAVEVSSPVTGKVVKLAGEPGDVIAVGSMLVVIDTTGTSDEGRTTGAKEAAPEPAPAATSSGSVTELTSTSSVTDPELEPIERVRTMTSPAIRRRAKEAGIDLAMVPGTGPGGRIVRKDFDRYLKARAAGAVIAAPTVPSTKVKEIKIIGVRRIIAERMQSAKLEIPHFAYVEEIDITELESLRKHLNTRKDAAERLTILPFLGLALIRTLREFPQCNVTHDKDRNLLLQHEAVHIGIATQTADGHKVPVIRHAEM